MPLIPKVQRDTIESTSPRIIRHSHVFLIALFFHLLSIFHLAVSVGQSRTIKTRFIGIELVTPPRIAYATSECQSFPIKNSFNHLQGVAKHYGNNLSHSIICSSWLFSWEPLTNNSVQTKTLEANSGIKSLSKRPWTLARSSRPCCSSKFLYTNTSTSWALGTLHLHSNSVETLKENIYKK